MKPLIVASLLVFLSACGQARSCDAHHDCDIRAEFGTSCLNYAEYKSAGAPEALQFEHECHMATIAVRREQ